MNKLFLIGNITADPQSRTTQDGKQVCTFTVAANRRRTANANQPDADFLRISAWGELGNNCAKYLTKGKKVNVIGPVSISTYTTQNGEKRAQMNVFAESVEFLSPAGQQTAPQKTDTQSGFVQVDDEEVPF